MSVFKERGLRTRTIGLTGGIATGKTTVSNYVANVYQLPVFDADLYAREAVSPGSKILESIARRYGRGILRADGTLNRVQLGDIIFHDAAERSWLEEQIHPEVRDRLAKASQLHPDLAVLAVPLLFEAKMTDLCTEIWVVYCPPPQQLERLVARDRLSFEQAVSRIHSQMPIEEKCHLADVVLDNSSTQDYLLRQVDVALSRGCS